jgi:hypothetical protein
VSVEVTTWCGSRGCKPKCQDVGGEDFSFWKTNPQRVERWLLVVVRRITKNRGPSDAL